MRRLVLLIAAFFVSAPATRADYAVLRSGARLHITGYDRRGAMIRLDVEGGRIEVAASDVVSIEPEEVFTPATKPAAASGPYSQLIRSAAERNGVDEKLVSSVIAAESNFNPHAVSPKQAQGLMQLLPNTAAQYAVKNAFDPAQNIEGGTRYLKDLIQQYHGDIVRALAAYNAGSGQVERYHGVPPFPETLDYLRHVTTKLEQLEKNAQASPDH